MERQKRIDRASCRSDWSGVPAGEVMYYSWRSRVDWTSKDGVAKKYTRDPQMNVYPMSHPGISTFLDLRSPDPAPNSDPL